MPNIINELALEDLEQRLRDASSLLLVDPSGLKSEESLALRRQIGEVGGAMRQAKARLIRRACSEDLAAHLQDPGSLAVIVGDDIAAIAKVVDGLAKQEKIRFRAGMIEGRPVDAAAAARFAELPSKHEARAMVARAIRAPAVRLARLLKTPYRRLGRALKAHHEKQEEAG